MTIALVSGALANKCWNGGNAWTRLAWLLGLMRLGVDTYFVEQIQTDARTDPAGAAADIEQSEACVFFRQVIDEFGLSGRAALILNSGTSTLGMTLVELRDLATAADLLVNIGGHLTLEPLKRAPACKVYFDDDPGYTQFWHAAGKIRKRLQGHDY